MPEPQRRFDPLQAQLIADAFNAEDIICSKEATGRQKDLLDLHLLKQFLQVYEQTNAPRRPLRSSLGTSLEDNDEMNEESSDRGIWP